MEQAAKAQVSRCLRGGRVGRRKERRARGDSVLLLSAEPEAEDSSHAVCAARKNGLGKGG